MPATEAAVAVTDAYRRQLINLRDQIVAVAGARFDLIDLDADDLDRQVRSFVDEVTTTVELGQREAARRAGTYVTAYVEASGATSSSDPVDPDRYAGLDPFGRRINTAIASAPGYMLWRLGRSDGRARAVATGLSRLTTVTRTAVMGSARSAQADQMAAEPAIAGWRRVTSARPCGACLGAADGTVYRTSAEFDLHDSCRCTSEPVIDGAPERYRRPTGQEIFDRLSRDEQAALFRGRGGAEKAAAVRSAGVDALVTHDEWGRLTESALSGI